MNKIIKKIKNVDEIYKKSFYIICTIAFFVFFRELISLRWGNHDWYSILNSVPVFYGWHEGRFFFTILQFLTGFKCITYISNTLYLFGLIFGLMLLIKYWEIPKKVSNIVLFVLFYLLMPSTLCFMYYKTLSLDLGLGLFFTVLSILTALKINKVENIKEKIIYFLISYISLFVFVLGTYQPFINTILVILSGKLLLDYTDSGFKISSIKEYIKEHKYFFIVLILSIISEFWLINILEKLNFFERDYNSTLINFNMEEITNRFIYLIKLMYEFLFTTFPYIGMYVKVLLFIVVLFAFLLSIIKIFRKKIRITYKLQSCLTFTFLFILTMWLSLFSYFITPEDNGIMLRVNHIGYDFVYLLCLAILIKFVKSDLLKKSVIVLSILIIYNSGISTIYAQQISDMGFNAEMQFKNRVLARIEQHPDFSYDKKYSAYIIIGYYESLKSKFYNGVAYKKNFEEVFYNDYFYDLSFKCFTPYEFIANNIIYYYDFYKCLKKIKSSEELKNYILNTAKVWPDKDSVYVSDEYIVVVFDEKELERLKEILL